MKNMSEESIKKIVIIGSIIILAVTIFTISYIVASNINKEEYIAEANTEVESQTASTSVGKNVEESEKSANKIANESNGINEENSIGKMEDKDIKDNNKETKVTSSQVNEEKKNSNKNNEKSEKKSEKAQDKANNSTEESNKGETEGKQNTPSFVAPVEGEILKEFSMDSLVYSETLKEWTTHSGLDIRAEKSTVVKASADGKVKSIKNDPRYGLTVVIEHDENYQTVYANLLTTEFVKEGEEVKQGQSIGTVGNTAMFEISDPSHLHFEILKDGVAVNPGLYL